MKTKLHFCLIFAAFTITFSLISGCSKTESEYHKPEIRGIQGINEVWIHESGFNPTSLTVDVNTTVIWSNRDYKDHTVSSDDGKTFDSGNIEPGFEFSHPFTSRGIFSYQFFNLAIGCGIAAHIPVLGMIC